MVKLWKKKGTVTLKNGSITTCVKKNPMLAITASIEVFF